MKHKLTLLCTLILTIFTFISSLWATSTLSPIQAFLNNQYTYTYNGQAILKNVPAIIYNNMAYVPIYNFAKELGYNVTVTESGATLDLPNATSPSKPTTPSIPSDGITIEKAQVVAIDFADSTMTIIPDGKPNVLNNQIVLRITPDTIIQSTTNKKIYKLSELEPGINVKVVHSPVMTKSIPPQTVAYSITIL